jgi:hypothetical protein
MKLKVKKGKGRLQPFPETPPAEQSSSAPLSPAPEASGKAFPDKAESSGAKQPYWKRPKIIVRLNPETGQPNWDSMPDSTVQALRRALADPQAAKVLQTSIPVAPGAPAPAAQLPPAFSEDAVKAIYDGVGMLEAGIFAFLMKVPYSAVKGIWAYDEMEKAMLVGPSTAVINKWGTEWMKKYADEIALAFLLTAITRGKVDAALDVRARLIREAQEKREKENKRPSIVAPMPTPHKEEQHGAS